MNDVGLVFFPTSKSPLLYVLGNRSDVSAGFKR